MPGGAGGAAPRHVFLIDGSGFLFRAFHALPPMTRPDGTPVNAVFGFTNMLIKLIGDTDADHNRRYLRQIPAHLSQRHLPGLQGAPAGSRRRS